MNADLLNLELPADHEHPAAPALSWCEYVAFVAERQRELLKGGRYAEMLRDFEETHRGEPFVMHD